MTRGVYMDVHVPSAITDGLRLRGIDVLTSQEDETRQLSDDQLLERATSLKRPLFTQDGDLLVVAAEWQLASRSFAGVVYSHQQGPGIGTVIEDLELVLLCAHDEELQNRVVWLPLA